MLSKASMQMLGVVSFLHIDDSSTFVRRRFFSLIPAAQEMFYETGGSATTESKHPQQRNARFRRLIALQDCRPARRRAGAGGLVSSILRRIEFAGAACGQPAVSRPYGFGQDSYRGSGRGDSLWRPQIGH